MGTSQKKKKITEENYISEEIKMRISAAGLTVFCASFLYLTVLALNVAGHRFFFL
jgi:hypothetical protein